MNTTSIGNRGKKHATGNKQCNDKHKTTVVLKKHAHSPKNDNTRNINHKLSDLERSPNQLTNRRLLVCARLKHYQRGTNQPPQFHNQRSINTSFT